MRYKDLLERRNKLKIEIDELIRIRDYDNKEKAIRQNKIILAKKNKYNFINNLLKVYSKK